jgi:branched-subunit amino acid transport protein
MTDELVVLAILMGAVTYPWRAIPLLAPGFDRLPTLAIDYLRLVGPAVLAALAAVGVLVVSEPSGGHGLRVGIELVAVVIGVAVVRWRKNVFLGILSAVLIVAVVRLATAG